MHVFYKKFAMLALLAVIAAGCQNQSKLEQAQSAGPAAGFSAESKADIRHEAAYTPEVSASSSDPMSKTLPAPSARVDGGVTMDKNSSGPEYLSPVELVSFVHEVAEKGHSPILKRLLAEWTGGSKNLASLEQKLADLSKNAGGYYKLAYIEIELKDLTEVAKEDFRERGVVPKDDKNPAVAAGQHLVYVSGGEQQYLWTVLMKPNKAGYYLDSMREFPSETLNGYLKTPEKYLQ
ncbi:hypothetical protein [Paenibacillus sp. FJAT-26967]|uniref:hypothetical protein n=1 Tax=Paenibacillus sp. FJAT-26967 TaxID=1729690 RepID=UPI0008385364|nr:hypothetical protein [Paenibacillus sp. FJAT-26967]